MSQYPLITDNDILNQVVVPGGYFELDKNYFKIKNQCENENFELVFLNADDGIEVPEYGLTYTDTKNLGF